MFFHIAYWVKGGFKYKRYQACDFGEDSWNWACVWPVSNNSYLHSIMTIYPRSRCSRSKKKEHNKFCNIICKSNR